MILVSGHLSIEPKSVGVESVFSLVFYQPFGGSASRFALSGMATLAA
jgi:hypothetical protein